MFFCLDTYTMATSGDMQRTSAHIPMAIQGPLLSMTFEEPIKGDQPTIFVGVTDASYTQSMWDDHKKQFSNLFSIKSSDCIREMKVECPGRIIDQTPLLKTMTEITAFINQKKSFMLRIVGLGVGSGEIITDALEALIKQWDIPLDEKHVQFVSLGESVDYHYLNFCRGLCMKQVCKRLQYYNTMDYNSFGYLRLQSRSTDHTSESLRTVLSQNLSDSMPSGTSTPASNISSLHLR